MLAGAVGTAIEKTVRFHAVTDDPTATMRASRCESVDGTFEAIEYMYARVTGQPHFKAFVVYVAAYLTLAYHFFIFIHHLPLSYLLFVPSGLSFLDVLSSRPRLSGCRLGALGNILPILGFEAITTHVDRL